jgi:CIC family chloride channel protein
MTSAGGEDLPAGKPVGLAAFLRALVRASEVWLVVAAVIVGVAAGAGVVVMSRVSMLAHTLIFGIPLDAHLSAEATVTVGAALTAPVAGGLALGAMEWWRRRHAIPPAVDPVEANALHGGRMSLRDSLVVSAQTLISNGCGASVGLEAGYSQMGAGLASRTGVALRLRRSDLRILVGCGAAAAIAAAFGAPLTGAFYAFELIIGFYSVANAAAVAGAALAAVLTAQALGGAPYSIDVASISSMRLVHYGVILLLGAVVAGLGVAVMRAVALVEKGFEASRIPYWLRPAAGGLVVGALALISPQVLAAGHGAMQLDLPLDMPAATLASLIGLKLTATLVSLGSGFRGGLFFASLFVGSLAGKLFGKGVDAALPSLGMAPAACALAGMGVLAVAIVGGPLTMSFLVLETTGDFGLTGAVLTACVVASLFVRETFGYSFSTWRLHLRGETIRSAHDVGWIRTLTVGKLMRREERTIPSTASLAEFRRRYPLGSTSVVVAVDDDGRYAGMVPTVEAFAAARDAELVKVAEILRLPDTALKPEMNIKDALAAFDQSESETLAVLDPDRKVLGVLTEGYAIRRYAGELDQANKGMIGD